MSPLFAKSNRRNVKDGFSVGVDIGSSSIKFIKLRHLGDNIELASLAAEAVGLDLVPTLKKLSQENDFKKCNVSISGASSITRYINFPKMNETELKQALKFEAQKHIPFGINEVDLDSYILKDDLPDGKMLVLLGAAKKELVIQRIKVLDDAGLKPNIIDMDSMAVVNAFVFNYPEDEYRKNKAIAILNIGAAYTNLSILDVGIPRLSRDIHIAGNNFTNKLMDNFSLDFDAAEKLKINPEKEKLGTVASAIESVLINLSAEVRTSLDYYESQNTSSVNKIFLAGGSCCFAGLKDMLSNFIGVEVEIWDPFRKMSLPAEIDADKAKSLSVKFGVAVGLALRQ